MAISARPAADDLATLYACDVLDGKVVAGELVKASCARHLKDLDGGSARGLSFDVGKAKRHSGFFPAVLTVTEGTAAGRPFHLLPWHGFVVASLFGWQRSDGLRRFRMAWLETGKGQAKSPLMAGIGVDMMGYAGKERSEVYAIAGDKDQANVLFKDAVAMCRANLPDRDEDEYESLESRGDVVIRGTGDNAWRIEHPETGSKFQSMASVDSISGPRPYAVLADEIHEFKTAYSLQIWKAAIDKMSGDPLMILGTNTPAINQIVGSEYSDLFQKVVKGPVDRRIDAAFVASMGGPVSLEQYGLPPADDTKKRANEYEKAKKAIDDTIASLKFEQEQLSRNSVEQRINNELKRAGVDITSQAGQQIANLVAQIEAETQTIEANTQAQEARAESIENLFDIGADALTSIADGSVKAEDALKKLVLQLALAAAQAALLGTGPLAGLFGSFNPTAGGFASMLGIPGYAKGTNNHPGGLAIVGEKGPELLNLPRGSQVIPQMPRIAENNNAGGVTYAPQLTIHAPNAQPGVGAEIEAAGKKIMEQMRKEFPVNTAKALKQIKIMGMNQ